MATSKNSHKPAGFTAEERAKLSATHMVGPKVIQRLEDIGVRSFLDLSTADARDLAARISENIGSSCWKNNRMAIESLSNAIETARQG